MSGTILLVEDEMLVRETVREVLEDEGYTVAEAANGREALDWLRANPAPSLVVLDLMMPVVSGYEVLKAVEPDPLLRKIPILIVSAAEREKLEAAVKQSTARAYLMKPLQLEPLLTKVAELVA